jgi:hypothetical protein
VKELRISIVDAGPAGYFAAPDRFTILGPSGDEIKVLTLSTTNDLTQKIKKCQL